MKIVMNMFWCILAVAVAANATDYTVKSGGGGNYTSIQACASAAIPGDICTVFAGTYNETPSITKSGTSSSRITFTVNTGDKVQVYGFVLDADYITIDGFYITDPSLTHSAAGIDVPHSHTGDHITNNTITEVGSSYPCIMTHGSGEVSYMEISGNTISWCVAVQGAQNPNAATGIQANGDHFLIQDNAISHTTNGISGDEDHTIIRNNTWGPVNDTIDFPGCQEVNGCDTHADYLEFGQSSSTRGYLVIEGNYENNIFGVGGAHAWLGNNVIATQAISRFNTQYQVGSGYLANSGSSTTFQHWKDYNNTLTFDQIQNSGGGNVAAAWQAPNIGSSIFNDLFYNDANPSGSVAPYYSFGGATVTSGHNLAFDTGCLAGTLASCTSAPFKTDAGNMYADPKLVAIDGSSFQLQNGSPALNVGTYLTTVASTDTGSGSLLIVNDAGFFQDGYGISGVYSDCVSVTTVTNHVCIKAVNYQTNALTLSSGIARSAGDPVWLYSDSTGGTVLIGSGPNIGAGFEGPAPPTGLAALVN